MCIRYWGRGIERERDKERVLCLNVMDYRQTENAHLFNGFNGLQKYPVDAHLFNRFSGLQKYPVNAHLFTFFWRLITSWNVISHVLFFIFVI